MIRVYDADGNEKDMQWAQAKYNLPPIDEAPKDKDHWEVVELHECIGPSSMTVRLIGDKVAGVSIAFGWPDGLDFQDTNVEGQTGFGMGPGAYYRPDRVDEHGVRESGPHFVFVNSVLNSDEIVGLGMIAGTNHAHLEPTFQFVLGEEEPGPGDTTREALVALLNGLEEGVEKAWRALE